MYAFNSAAIFLPGHPYIESTTVLSDIFAADKLLLLIFLAVFIYTSYHVQCFNAVGNSYDVTFFSRLYLIIPALVRIIAEDLVLLGYQVPAGVSVCFAYALCVHN